MHGLTTLVLQVEISIEMMVESGQVGPDEQEHKSLFKRAVVNKVSLLSHAF